MINVKEAVAAAEEFARSLYPDTELRHLRLEEVESTASSRKPAPEAEVEIAQLFEKASHAYQGNPTALQLRQMNILYEGLEQKGGMMVVPSSIVDSMGASGVLSAASLAKQSAAEAEERRAQDLRVVEE
jgi:hypothetical protein